jgi:hypothetical protein
MNPGKPQTAPHNERAPVASISPSSSYSLRFGSGASAPAGMPRNRIPAWSSRLSSVAGEPFGNDAG